MTTLGENLVGAVLDGKYELKTVLGEGGMSVVYRACRVRIGDEVALKVLRPEITRDIVSQARFEREAQVAARIKHPNIVTVHDFGTSDNGYTYLVMELLAGPTLEQEMRNHYVLPIDRAVSILIPVCQAVGAAHREQVVHRDLKPSNILLHHLIDGQEIVKVVDFGIVKTGRVSEHRLTQVNIILGTPPYMSPEQCYGREVDHRSDIYSLGVIAYEALTGELPFDGLSVLEIMEAHVKKPALPLRQLRSDIPPALEFAVLKALSKQPEQRYESAEAFARELAEAAGLQLRQPSQLAISPSVASQSEHSTISTRKTTRAEMKFLDTRATLKARSAPDFTQFVGRQKEMERLQGEYGAFLHGRARPVIVSGEQGVGLSKFGEVFKLWARKHGAGAMLSRFYESSNQQLQFWLDLVRRALGISRRTLTGDAQLAELISTRTGIEVPECMLQGNLSGESEKWRVFEAVNLMLLRVLSNHPGVLIFDNVQYADPFSLEMLSYLHRNSRNCIFQVFLVQQEVLAKRTHPVSEWALQLNRSTGYEALKLQPFSRQELGVLLEAIFGRIDLTERHLGLLWEVTKGNAFYVSEILRLILNDGRLKLEGETWKYTEPKAVELPGSLQQLAEMRLRQLPEPTLELLRMAAVIGYNFSLEVLLEVSGRDEDEVVEVLEQAVRNGILEEAEGHGEDYCFRDLTLTLVLYRGLSRRRRKQIHAQVADFLVQEAGSIERKRRRLSGRILYHYHEAGDAAKTLDWACLAAEAEAARMDLLEAYKYYSWGLEAAAALEEDEPVDRTVLSELYLGQAATCLKLSRLKQARQMLGDALELARELKSPALEARAKLVSSQLKFALDELEEAISEAEEGLELAQRCGIQSLESAFLMMLARTYNKMGRTEDALGPLECNLELARQLQDTSTESQVLSMLGRILSMAGNFRQAEVFLDDALRLARGRKDRLSELLALLRMGQLSCQLGQYDRALEVYELGVDMVRPLQDRLLEGAFLNGLGDVYLALKEVDSARSCYQKYLQLSEAAGNSGYQAIASYKLALVALELGILPDALNRLEPVLKQARRLGDQRLACDVLTALGSVYEQMGRIEEAKSAYLESIELAQQTAQTSWEAHYGLASVLLMKGRRDEARNYAVTAVQMLEGMAESLPDTVTREEFLSDKRRAYSLLEELEAN